MEEGSRGHVGIFLLDAGLNAVATEGAGDHCWRFAELAEGGDGGGPGPIFDDAGMIVLLVLLGLLGWSWLVMTLLEIYVDGLDVGHSHISRSIGMRSDVVWCLIDHRLGTRRW